ncbi:Adenylosuccinate synthetase OS=Ureibacillus acetophenoni OX=614649 GN=purA PE=3 SV=1 [Ureibacillus acetophenoni]
MDEESRVDKKIGTTIKGIGDAIKSKIARMGIRIADLLDREVFEQKLRDNLEKKNRLFDIMKSKD